MAQFESMKVETAQLKAKQSYFESVAARLEALELKLNAFWGSGLSIMTILFKGIAYVF